MEKYALNDINYNFKPFEIFTPDPDYKVDKDALEKSIQKSRDIRNQVKKIRKAKQETVQK